MVNADAFSFPKKWVILMVKWGCGRMENQKLGCLILAAGCSSRFQSNKLTALFEGKPLIRRTLEAVPTDVFSSVTVVTQYDGVEELAREFGFACVRNDRPDLGQSRSVALGTAAMADCDGIAFVVADQPLLSQELLRRIAAEWRAHPDCIVGAAHAGKRGNPNLFPKRFFPELLALTGDVGGSSVIRAHPECFRSVETDAASLTDVDTPQALEVLRGRR